MTKNPDIRTPRTETTHTRSGRPGRLPAWGVLIGLSIGLVVGLLTTDGVVTISGRLGGDFQAFYGAGRIAAAGDWENLYDHERQREAQEPVWEQGTDTVLYFAYPPAIALLYAPFTALEFRWSFLLHTLLMVGAVALSLHLLKPGFPWLRDHMPEALAAALFFYPLMRATLGGQNTALSLLLLVATWRLVADGRWMAAGIALAALFYKPQYAVPLAGLFFLDRRWRVLVGVGLGLVIAYALNASLMGVDWPFTWWNQAVEFARLDAAVNRFNSVSWVGFFQAVRGPSDPLGLAIGWALAVSHLAFLVYFWLWAERTDWAARFAVTSVGILLISPHTMYYDAGLLLLALGLPSATVGLGRATWGGLLLIWALAPLQAAAGSMGFSPTFFLLVAAAIWTGTVLSQRARWPVSGVASR